MLIIEAAKGKKKGALVLTARDDAGAIAGVYEVPAALGALADHLYARREARRELERAAEAIAAEEGAIREHLIATLPKTELATGIAGAVGRVTIRPDDVPRVADWAKLYKYIAKTGAFELLQRRLADGAVRERWEAKKAVPGVDAFTVLKLSVTKVRA